MENNSRVEKHLDWLLRNYQIDLGNLERERLEQLTEGLLQGQVIVFGELARETRQTEVIEAQKELIRGLQQQLGGTQALITNANNAVAALQDVPDQFYQDNLLLLADLIMRTWDRSSRDQVAENLMTGLWRCVTEAISRGDTEADSPIAQWWTMTARTNFGFPMAQDLDESVLEEANV